MSRVVTRLTCVPLAFCLFTAPARLGAQMPDGFFGTWLLDKTASTFGGAVPFYGGTPPAKRVMTFERIANGLRHIVETTTTELKEVYRTQYTFQVDGQEYPVDPQMPLTTVSFRRGDARTIVRTGTYRGKAVETITYTLSADGRALTATQVGANRDVAGNEIPINSVQVFRRQ